MRPDSTRTSRSGSGLLVVVFTMALVAFMVATVFSVTNTNVQMTRRMVTRAEAVSYGDGVLEVLYDQWRQAMVNVTDADDRQFGRSTDSLKPLISAPSNTDLPIPPGMTLLSSTVKAVTPMMADLDGKARPTIESGTRSKLRVRVYYKAQATVQYRTAAGNATVTVERIFVRAGRNLFDNFFFGTQPNVEYHPGPDMYVNGTVYVAGKLYTAHNSLKFMKDVNFGDKHVVDFRTEDSRYGKENPDIDNNGFEDNWNINNPPRRGEEQKLLDTPISSLDPNFLDDPVSNNSDSDSNPNNDGFHELVEERSGTKTDPLQLDPSTSERLADNADYRIYVDKNNNIDIYGASTTKLATTSNEYKAVAAALTTNTALKDVRDGDNVRLITVDVSKISAAKTAGTIADTKGENDGFVFYVADTSQGSSVSTKIVNSSTKVETAVTSSRSRGVKLVNGGTLPDVGLTMVSPNAVYIQGDYNTGTTSSSKPASNTATKYTPPNDTPSPVVTNYTRAPSAVVGDAVNILSNNWNDANSTASKSSRPASHTTVNTAIVSGNVPTTTSSYSGGIENFVRFHENWDNTYFTVYGALALLFDSQQATRPWSAADYSAPQRRWYYDSLLQDNNPPGFRVARVYSRGSWAVK